MGLKFRYIGEYPEGKTELVVFGCVFSPGAEIEVPSQFVGKAQGNRFFEEVAEPAHTGVVDPEWDFDPNKAYEKDELIAIAEARGVKIDKRWSLERMTQAIKDA